MGRKGALTDYYYYYLDGVPAQLAKLTCLHLDYHTFSDAAAAGPWVDHLSTLTALRRLEVRYKGGNDTRDLASALSGIALLSQLTHLALRSSTLDLTSASTSNWAQLTALQSLELKGDFVQPTALAAFTQLRTLQLHGSPAGGDSSQELVDAVSNMLQLTELQADLHGHIEGSSCTALLASTQLSVLRLKLPGCTGTRNVVLFRLDTVYPHLRLIDLDHKGLGLLTLSGQQIQLLSSSCPALESLNFRICSQASHTDCLPLRQLTALTRLRVCELSNAAAAGAVITSAAQLTGLVQLSLLDLPKMTDPKLMQLSALTALTDLKLSNGVKSTTWSIQARNQVG
jgi:hypothetical protein